MQIVGRCISRASKRPCWLSTSRSASQFWRLHYPIRPLSKRSDHSFSLPEPERALKKGTKLRCNACEAVGDNQTMVESKGLSSHGNCILGIESSCDDTAVAILRLEDGAILGHSIANQVDIHAPWGGVVPNLAQQAHKAAIDRTVDDALQQASLKLEQIDAVAVTIGPGLSLCLKWDAFPRVQSYTTAAEVMRIIGLQFPSSLEVKHRQEDCNSLLPSRLKVGVLKAMELAHNYKMKFLPVHHMEAHALVARQAKDVSFPFLCLLVSGGHNMLVIAHGIGDYTLLGSTLDDALGEAFDKVARLLGLEMRPNGGSAVEKLAKQGNENSIRFSVPLRKFQDCNFSYAGTKTAVRLAIESKLPEGPTEGNLQVRADIAASFQKVAVEHLAVRCKRAAAWAKEDFPEMQHMVVAGGVACNARVRSTLAGIAEEAGLDLICPSPALCTDNGVMVAWAGAERLRLGLEEEVPPLPAPEDAHLIDVRPRWPLTNRMDRRLRVSDRGQRKARIFPSLTEISQAHSAQAKIPALH